MPFHDLSLVSQVLVRLVRDRVASSPGWLPRPAPSVTPHPPDRLTGEEIGFYLYHSREEASRKNVPPPGPGMPPVRFTPMGLSLYYMLTAHSEGDGDERTYAEQRLMGCAMKALHDFPFLDDTTVVSGSTPLFELLAIDGGDNRLRIELQPIPFEQAVAYWTASSSQPRLAAYYQISVVLLEPERIASRTGRVLTYGVHTFVTSAPHIDTTENRLTFAVPGEAALRTLDLRPAQVPYGGVFSILGTGLAGDETSLVLRTSDWSRSVKVDAGWGVVAGDSKLVATVAEQADGEEVLPGVFSAGIEVIRRRRMPDGTMRDFPARSNQSPFTITPELEPPGPLGPLGVFRIKGYVFAHPKIAPDQLEVYIGGTRLDRGTVGSLAEKEFGVVDARELEIRLPATAGAGLHLIRIVVRGAEAPPRFIEVP